MALDYYGGTAPTNNEGIDPLSGYDFEVWVQESQTGNLALFGRFQSLSLSIRDATETYIELGKRIPIYLNGEIQIAWVLEQGLVDMEFIARSFGLKEITRGNQRLTRGPRFSIGFNAQATDISSQYTGNRTARLGNPALRATRIPAAIGFEAGSTQPTVDGRYEVVRCKMDSVSLAIMPGRRVAAVRWEGVAEGIVYQTGHLSDTLAGGGTGATNTPPTQGKKTNTIGPGGIPGKPPGR